MLVTTDMLSRWIEAFPIPIACPELNWSFRGRRDFQHPPIERVKCHISQLKQATTAIHRQIEDDPTPAVDDPNDNPDPPQRKCDRPRKPVPAPRALGAPDDTVRPVNRANISKDRPPPTPTVPQRKRAKPIVRAPGVQSPTRSTSLPPPLPPPPPPSP
jgi:hypothetical protein